MDKSKITNSTKYLLPLFADENDTFNKYTDNTDIFTDESNFINAYNVNVNQFGKGLLYIVYDYVLDRKYFNRHKKLMNCEHYLYDTMYIVNNKKYLVYCFKISDDLVDAVETVSKGDLKDLPFEIKNRICKFWGYNENIIKNVDKVIPSIEDEIGENSYVNVQDLNIPLDTELYL